MNIRDILNVEAYIKETVKDYANRVKEAGDSMECDRKVVLPIGTAERIANCLDLLEGIITSYIDGINVEDLNISYEEIDFII